MIHSLLEQELLGISLTDLKKEAQNLSEVYRNEHSSRRVFATSHGCLAYLATRLPATYGAVSYVLREMKQRLPGWQGKSLLDLGAGPGTASWAAVEEFLSFEECMLVEQNTRMMEKGKKFAAHHPLLKKATWIQTSLDGISSLPQADLAMVSYTLGELRNPSHLLEQLWTSGTPLVILVEPGTPRGFELICHLRQLWLQWSGHIIAPCPHAHACPLQKGDWCHFSTRIPRSKLHRQLKEGQLGYEDEKFSYLILSKTPQPVPIQGRILRYPQHQKGKIQIISCTSKGSLEPQIVTKKDKEAYKQAKGQKWGDSM